MNSQKLKEQLEALKKSGISYKKISDFSGVNYSSIRNLACGYRTSLSESNYQKLKAFFQKYQQFMENMEVDE